MSMPDKMLFYFFRFRALYNYRPQNDDEVELTEGDVVYVMEKCDDGNLDFIFPTFFTIWTISERPEGPQKP